MGAGKVELYAVDPGILKGLRGTHPIPFCSILGAHDTLLTVSVHQSRG
jgi:hypothetical protein